jgi:hypothetical protein
MTMRGFRCHPSFGGSFLYTAAIVMFDGGIPG